MNVKQLKEAIENLPDDMEVILQKDAEGSGYSPLSGVDPNAVYVEESSWYGTVYDATESADDVWMEEDEWEAILDRPRVLVLFPVNSTNKHYLI